MHLSKAIFINRAPFDNLELSFQEQGINVLSAINGRGKTTILSYIVDAFHEMARPYFRNSYNGIENTYYRLSSPIFQPDSASCSIVYLRFVHDDEIVDYIEEDEEEYEDVCEYTDEEEIDIRERLASCVKNPKYVFHSVSRDKIVQMTDEQYKKLLELVESDVLTAYIRKLELLIKNEGYRTFSPYKTIKRWILEDTKL